jgi:hypothetical protein
MPRIRRGNIRASSETRSTQPPEDAGWIEFDDPEPAEPERDRVLGAYMGAWNQLESAISDMLQKLLGVHRTAADVLLSVGINQNTIRELIVALGEHRLDQQTQKELQKLIEQARSLTTKRNRIVHGVWSVNIQVNKDTSNTATWERYYPPANPKTLEKMSGPSAKATVQDQHRFSIGRIKAITQETHDLATLMRSFGQKMVVADFLYAQPVKDFSK